MSSVIAYDYSLSFDIIKTLQKVLSHTLCSLNNCQIIHSAWSSSHNTPKTS